MLACSCPLGQASENSPVRSPSSGEEEELWLLGLMATQRQLSVFKDLCIKSCVWEGEASDASSLSLYDGCGKACNATQRIAFGSEDSHELFPDEQ